MIYPCYLDISAVNYERLFSVTPMGPRYDDFLGSEMLQVSELN